MCRKCYRNFNPFPNNPWFLRVYITSLLKTLSEKEKLLVTSIQAPFLTVFPTRLENCLSFSSHLKLSSANSFNLEESKFAILEKVKEDNASYQHFLPIPEVFFFKVIYRKYFLALFSKIDSCENIVYRHIVNHLLRVFATIFSENICFTFSLVCYTKFGGEAFQKFVEKAYFHFPAKGFAFLRKKCDLLAVNAYKMKSVLKANAVNKLDAT